MAIKKGDLVIIENVEDRTALVISDIYCTVFTTDELTNKFVASSTKGTLLSSEVLVVDVLFEDSVYKKVPINTLVKVRS